MEWVRAVRCRFGGNEDELRPLVPNMQEAEIDERNQRTRIRDAVLVLGTAAMGIAILAFSEGWSVLTTVYVLAQMITSVGYGDFTVHSDAGRLLLSFYSLFVLVVLAHFFNGLMNGLLERQEKILRSHLRGLHQGYDQSEQPIEDYIADRAHGARHKVIACFMLFKAYVLLGTLYYRFSEHCTCEGAVLEIDLHCDPTSYTTCAATGGTVKGLAESFYMSVITLTSIGFGDHLPRTAHGRAFAIFYMISGVVVTAMFFSAMSQYFFEHTREDYLNAQEFMVDIQEREFRRIDREDKGYLTKAEFLVYTLRKYGGVPDELLMQIWTQYDKADPHETGITLEMLHRQQNALRIRRERSWREGHFV